MSETRATQFKYDDFLESALARIAGLLKGSYGISKRIIGLLLLQGDLEIERLVREQEASGYQSIQ